LRSRRSRHSRDSIGLAKVSARATLDGVTGHDVIGREPDDIHGHENNLRHLRQSRSKCVFARIAAVIISLAFNPQRALSARKRQSFCLEMRLSSSHTSHPEACELKALLAQILRVAFFS
jgi:hypothetical protein